MRAKLINESSSTEYTIYFYYADHPSIEGECVATLVDTLKDLIKEIDPGAIITGVFMHNFSDGNVNIISTVPGRIMIEKIKENAERIREDLYSPFSPLPSWEYVYGEGHQEEGEIFDPEKYITHCPHCGGTEVDEEGYCWDCENFYDED